MEGIPLKEDDLPTVSPPPYTLKPEDPIPNKQYFEQPPPPGFIPNPDGIQPHQHVTVIQTFHLGSESQMVQCPHCGVRGMTDIQYKPNSITHTIALILCCCVCWPCAWVPYACDSCQSCHHSCSNCKAYIGEYHA